MAQINFGGVTEKVVLREEFPVEKAHEVLKDEVIAIIGYGVQGPAQALNMKDNGFNVIIGQAPEFKEDWDTFPRRRSSKKGNNNPIPGFRCSSAHFVAQIKTLPERGRCALFFTWFLNHLQRTNRRNTS
jgi:hypothetical protein